MNPSLKRSTRPSSMYVRPQELPPIELTTRDRDIIRAVFDYRFLSANHVHQLFFRGSSMRAVRRRLRLLWAHKLLDRFFRAEQWLAGEAPPRARPLYLLGPAGAALLARLEQTDVASIKKRVPNMSSSMPTLEHNLVAADALIAITSAAKDASAHARLRIDPEPRLWERIRAEERLPHPYIVPDGAATIARGGSQTFYLEVVRADVKRGNKTIAKKMERYAQLNHQGFFRRVYGHEHVRAVLWLTTSEERQAHLQTLAQDLTHGKHLHWFGAYHLSPKGGSVETDLTSRRLGSAMWTDTHGASRSLFPS